LPSFKEYVLVDQETPIVDVLYKMAEGDWRMKTYIGVQALIPLESIGITLKMADIYKNVPDLKDPQSVLEFDPDSDSD
jgi:Uma2 family endonuclease